MAQSENQKRIYRHFKDKPTLYHPGLAIITDSVPAGLVLNKLLYWHGKGKLSGGWIFKTMKELQSETGLSRYQQDGAIRKLKRMGVLSVKLKGTPAKRHFLLDIPELEKQLPSLLENHNLVYLKPPSYIASNHQRITKSTQENTPKINPNGLKRLEEMKRHGLRKDLLSDGTDSRYNPSKEQR